MYKFKLLILILSGFFGLIPLSVVAQRVQISVKENDKSPLPGATVQLTRMEDSATIFRIADEKGFAVFENTKAGVHTVRISFVGFQTLEKTILVKNGQQNFEYRMEADVVSLGEVQIIARRPLIRQEDDKMIIDPEPIAGMSTNTLEILETTPGLFVDPDGGIYLSSATPASIFINGREQKMGTQDLMNLLRNLPPGSIQRIEVMRTPSARYAASASGGIINIVLKKGMKIGRFGSINTGFNQGVYGNQFAGVSINNGGSRGSGYLNLNFSNNNLLEELSSSRALSLNNNLSQSAETVRKTKQAYLGYGIGYDLSDKLALSYDGRVSASRPESSSDNNNLIKSLENVLISETNNLVDNKPGFLNLSQEIGITYKPDTLGSEWDSKLAYNFSRNDGSQAYRTEFIFPVSGLLSGSGDNLQNRHFLQFQSDLSYALPRQLKLETGFNSSLQDYNSDADFTINQNGEAIRDLFRTNAFKYRENINAGYLQLSKPLPSKLLLKAGLRMEHTYMSGNQTVPYDTSFVINRSDWFPYVYLSRQLGFIAGYEFRTFLIYRKTITRPGYQSLNPSITYVDQFLYEAGNPALKPQFSDNMELNVSIDEMPIFAVGRTYTRDIFSNVVYQDSNDENIAVRTYDNLGKNRETYFRAVGAIPPVNKYFFVVGIQYNLNEYSGFYESQPLDYQRGSWRFFTFHSLRLTPDTRLTMSGFMMTGGQFNFYELETFGMLNFGLNQTFLNKKLNVTVSARDVLRTMVNKFTLNQGNIVTTGNRYTDNRRIGINIRYNFGIPDRQERPNPMRFDMEE